MSPFHWSLAVWAVWGLAFLILELLAVFDRVPWNTLSWTSWQIQARGPGFLSLAAAGGLFVLLLHIVFKWPGHKHKLPVEETEGNRLLSDELIDERRLEAEREEELHDYDPKRPGRMDY